MHNGPTNPWSKSSSPSLQQNQGVSVGGAMTTLLRYFPDAVNELLGVPIEQGWTMSAMVAFGYPLGRWDVAANRRPVHEVSSRNRWGASFGTDVPRPLWPGSDEPILGNRLRQVNPDSRC
ncbi:hypothetical protein MINTM001_42680 [Mycobacterium paraintracellulare]|nr:hypothetical protein MINTM001_42680 [Mycobacterium paraintracellulare]